MKETIHTTSFLPHESALGADPEYTGLTYAEAKVGNVGGGTIFAVNQEAKTIHAYGPEILNELTEQSASLQVTLDTPSPVTNFRPVQAFPFDTLTYDIPTYHDGTNMQWWDMREAYRQNERWMEQHIVQRTRPGKHIIFAHHNVGVGLETDFLKSEYGPNHIVAMRYHSQLVRTTELMNPEYFKNVYGSYNPTSPYFKESTKYLDQLQLEALNYGHVHFFSTPDETEATIIALEKAGIMQREEAERKLFTVPIPIDIQKFSEDDSDESKREAQISHLQHIDPSLQLDPSRRYIGTVSRRDHEKNIWDLVKAYGYFADQNRGYLDELSDLLIIGGPTNKPGVSEKEYDMWQYVASLPPEIQQKIHISKEPRPHEDVVHIFDMQIYPSWEESYNISEKQARAAGKLVALSNTAAGHTGTNKQDTAIWFEPQPLDDDITNADSYQNVFIASMLLNEYKNLVRNDLDLRLTPDQKAIEAIRQIGKKHAQENFSSQAILRETFAKLKKEFPHIFS